MRRAAGSGTGENPRPRVLIRSERSIPESNDRSIRWSVASAPRCRLSVSVRRASFHPAVERWFVRLPGGDHPAARPRAGHPGRQRRARRRAHRLAKHRWRRSSPRSTTSCGKRSWARSPTRRRWCTSHRSRPCPTTSSATSPPCSRASATHELAAMQLPDAPIRTLVRAAHHADGARACAAASAHPGDHARVAVRAAGVGVGRDARTTRTLIVDEIHAIAGTSAAATWR